MLIAFGGLPGSGKTTLAKRLAQQLSAVYLRIDTIEQALVDSNVLRADVGPAGYEVAYALAEENLSLGRLVVADSVNALQITRDSWRAVAQRGQAILAEVEVRCSDSGEHRRRIERRSLEGEGVPALTWQTVEERPYEPWLTAPIVIETAGRSIAEVTNELTNHFRDLRSYNAIASTRQSRRPPTIRKPEKN